MESNDGGDEPRPASAPARAAALDLLRSVTADAGRTANLVTVLVAAARGACLLVLALGVVGLAAAVAVAMLTHALGTGPAVGGAVALGGASWLARRARKS